MAELEQQERECLARYCSLLAERLGEDLLAVQMVGSEDIHLLVVTARELPAAEQEELTNETYPFYLECGRQFSPSFVSEDSLARPEVGRLRTQAVNVWPGPVTM